MSDLQISRTLTYGELPDAELLHELTKDQLPDGKYPMVLRGEDFLLVQRLVNQGIDSHLEAVSFEQDGPSIVLQDIGSLHTLLRRCLEDECEETEDFAASVLQSLDIEWV